MTQPVTLDQVLAGVGRVLLVWGWLESGLTATLDAAGALSLPGRSPLQRWRLSADILPASLASLTPEIERAARLRHLIAHGLIGAQSYPSPEVRVRTQTGAVVAITLADLDQAVQDLDRLRLAIRRA